MPTRTRRRSKLTKSEQVLRGMAKGRSKRHRLSRYPRIGQKFVKSHNGKMVSVVCWSDHIVMRYSRWMRNVHGLSYKKIDDRIEAMFSRRREAGVVPPKRHGSRDFKWPMFASLVEKVAVLEKAGREKRLLPEWDREWNQWAVQRACEIAIEQWGEDGSSWDEWR